MYSEKKESQAVLLTLICSQLSNKQLRRKLIVKQESGAAGVSDYTF